MSGPTAGPTNPWSHHWLVLFPPKTNFEESLKEKGDYEKNFQESQEKKGNSAKMAHPYLETLSRFGKKSFLQC